MTRTDGKQRREALAQVIRGRRGEIEITQTELASRMNRRPGVVSAWESAKSYPTDELFLELARALEISVENLLGLIESRLSSGDRGSGSAPALAAQLPVYDLEKLRFNSEGLPIDGRTADYTIVRSPDNADPYAFGIVIHGMRYFPFCLDGDLIELNATSPVKSGDIALVCRRNPPDCMLARIRFRGEDVICENPSQFSPEHTGTYRRSEVRLVKAHALKRKGMGV